MDSQSEGSELISQAGCIRFFVHMLKNSPLPKTQLWDKKKSDFFLLAVQRPHLAVGSLSWPFFIINPTLL